MLYEQRMFAAAILCHLAGRGRIGRQRPCWQREGRKPGGYCPEPALDRVLASSIDDDELCLRAFGDHSRQNGFDADPVARDFRFAAQARIDRDHVGLAAGLNAVSAEEQQGRRAALDSCDEPVDRDRHAVPGKILSDVHHEATAAQLSCDSPGIRHRLAQRLAGIRIAGIADHQCVPPSVVGGRGVPEQGRQHQRGDSKRDRGSTAENGARAARARLFDAPASSSLAPGDFPLHQLSQAKLVERCSTLGTPILASPLLCGEASRRSKHRASHVTCSPQPRPVSARTTA